MKALVWLAAKLRRVVCAYLLSLCLCAGAMVWLEGLAPVDALWYCGVTSLTIGYGDIAAKTDAGRLIVMMFAHFWVFVIGPVVIANIVSGIIQDRNEFSHEEQEEMKKLLQEVHQCSKLQTPKQTGVPV